MIRIINLPYGKNCREILCDNEVYRINEKNRVYWANDEGWIKIWKRKDIFYFDGYDFYFIESNKSLSSKSNRV